MCNTVSGCVPEGSEAMGEDNDRTLSVRFIRSVQEGRDLIGP